MRERRVACVMPFLLSYRVPVMERLAQEPGVRLTVMVDTRPERGGHDVVGASTTFEIRHSPFESLGPLTRQAALMDAAKDPLFDVVVLPWTSRNYQLGRAMREASRAGKGVVLWGHGSGTTLPWLGDVVRNRLISRADACVLYGPTARNDLIRRGHDAGRLFVAPNALDQSAIRAAVAEWSTDDRLDVFRRQEGIDGVPIVLYLARLEPEKRPDLLIDAMTEVLAKRSDAQLVFVGDGTSRRELEARAGASLPDGSFRFLGRIYDEQRIAPWALSSTCLVQPEKLGLSIFHAFGYGLPVVTGDDLGRQMPEVETLEDGVNGYWYRSGDVSDMAKKILSLMGDPETRERLSHGASRTVNGPEGRDTPAMAAGLLAAIAAAAERVGR